MFQTIAYGGTKETDLFQRVIGQSPGPKVGSLATQKVSSEAFLRALGMDSVDDARTLPTDVLIKANAMVERDTSGFGPSQ